MRSVLSSDFEASVGGSCGYVKLLNLLGCVMAKNMAVELMELLTHLYGPLNVISSYA